MTYTIPVAAFYDEPDKPEVATTRLVTISIPPTPPTPPLRRSRANSSADTSSVVSAEIAEARSVSPEISDGRVRIPKPPGEVGRPERGGYSLRATLDGDPVLYQQLLVRFTTHSFEYLNSGGCPAATGTEARQGPPPGRRVLDFAGQRCGRGSHEPGERITHSQYLRRRSSACMQGKTELPALDGYEKMWPLADAIRMRLKYTSARARAEAGTIKKKRRSTRLNTAKGKKVQFNVALVGSSK